jgi:hypothetical protein
MRSLTPGVPTVIQKARSSVVRVNGMESAHDARRARPVWPFLAPVLCLLSGSVWGLDWQIETADDEKAFSDMTDRSLCLDAQGHPHIAYGEDYLYHASFDGASWQLETVDPSDGVGRFAAVALDAAGFPHISYYDDANHDLKYAYKSMSGWHVQTVDSQGSVGQYTSVALGSSGFPHISYREDLDDELRYAYQDGSGWHIEIVESQGIVGENTSIAVGNGGSPRIGYCHSAYHDLRYARGINEQPMVLSGQLVADELVLTWSSVDGTDQYWVYGALNEPFFIPGFAPEYDFRVAVMPQGTTTWSSPAGVGDAASNWTYLVVAVDEVESELARSNRIGEHDFEAAVP